MTFLSVFDVPVFWPILLCYWLVLFVLTMKRQIMHMIKYKYVPFSFGKQVSGAGILGKTTTPCAAIFMNQFYFSLECFPASLSLSLQPLFFNEALISICLAVTDV